MEGVPNKKEGLDAKKAGIGLAAALSAALAAAPASGMDSSAQDVNSYDTVSYTESTTPAMPEALAVFESLNTKLQGKHAITKTQIKELEHSIDLFIKKNPGHPGHIIINEDDEGVQSATAVPSFDPLQELKHAILHDPKLNPVLIGFGVRYIDQLTKERDRN